MSPSPETAPSPDSSSDSSSDSSPPAPPQDNSSSDSSSSPPPPPPQSPPPSSSSNSPSPPSDDDDNDDDNDSSSSSSSSRPPRSSKSNGPPKSSSPSVPSPSDDAQFSPPSRDSGKSLPSSHTPSTHSNQDNSDTPSNNNGGSNSKPEMVAGIVVAALGAIIVVILVIACICCLTRKKKKKPHNGMQYYGESGRKGNDKYYNNAPPPKWHNGAQGGEGNLAPPPGALTPPPGGWHAPPPLPSMMTGSDASSAFSGPHGPPLPPPSPTLALGFNKSTFNYDELAVATGNFSPANLLGQGGFGYVYKGFLPNGKEIAVKQLKAGSGQGEREFQAEVDIISRVHHRHLVSLVGYCITGSHRMLVYEFVANKTLEHHLHGKGLPVMEFPTRLKIALGSAKGLAYLHEDCHPRIIHRDIKTANILLDFKFEAMVADFGLAKLSQDNHTHVSTRIMGTFGYLAPEYASSGKLTEKSDVFSYGIMLLELITGRRPVDNTQMEDSLVDWARPLLSRALADGNCEELVDPCLEGKYNTLEMSRMLASAAACVRYSARKRPKMSQIVRALEGDVSLEDLNEGVKPGQSMHFSSSSDYDSSSYSSNMRQFRKVALASTEFSEDYSRPTSEYGLNPSESSSSGEMNGVGRQRVPQPL